MKQYKHVVTTWTWLLNFRSKHPGRQMQFSKAFIPVFLYLFSKASAATLGELFRTKYHEVYNPSPGLPFTFESEDGVVETVLISLPLPLYADTLIDPDFIRIMDDFENNPLVVFNNKRFQTYLIYHAVRDYEADPISRDIINRCLQYGPNREFILLLLNVVVQYNRYELFYEIMSLYDAMGLDQHELFPIVVPIANAIVSSGNYHFAKWLITNGRYPAAASYMASAACTYGPNDKVQDVIDFLDFLLVKRQEFNVNEPIYPPIYGPKAPLLMILITGKKCREYKEAVGYFLVSIGADVSHRNDAGRTILELAEEQGTNLF